MVEWFKAAVLKTAEAKASGSSNLPLSAILKWRTEPDKVFLLCTYGAFLPWKRKVQKLT